MPYNAVTENPKWPGFANPVTSFTYNLGRLIDEDLENENGSKITVNKGTANEDTVTNIPSKLMGTAW